MQSPQNIRRAVLAAAVTSVTIAGTLYGAGLKTNEEIVEVSSSAFTTHPKQHLCDPGVFHDLFSLLQDYD